MKNYCFSPFLILEGARKMGGSLAEAGRAKILFSALTSLALKTVGVDCIFWFEYQTSLLTC